MSPGAGQGGAACAGQGGVSLGCSRVGAFLQVGWARVLVLAR